MPFLPSLLDPAHTDALIADPATAPVDDGLRPSLARAAWPATLPGERLEQAGRARRVGETVAAAAKGQG